MSIMDFFRPGNAASQQPVAQPQQTTNGQQQTAPQPGMQGQQPTPDLAAVAEPVGDLDAFKDLFTPVKKDPDAPADFNPGAIFNLDPAAMQEHISKIDFASAVTKDQLAAITEGGEGAMAAFVQAMNGVAQKTFQTSTIAAGKMVEQAMSQASQAMDKKIDGQVKQNQVSTKLLETNSALSHPAAAPIIGMIKAQLIAKYPSASADDIAKLANQYASEFANVAAGKKETPESQVPKGTNWDEWATN